MIVGEARHLVLPYGQERQQSKQRAGLSDQRVEGGV